MIDFIQHFQGWKRNIPKNYVNITVVNALSRHQATSTHDDIEWVR